MLAGMENLGKRIAGLRTDLGLTQEELAAEIRRRGGQVSRGAVGNWELGGGISGKNREILSEILREPLDRLANVKGRIEEIPVAHGPNPALLLPSRLPVFGTSEGGPGIDILSSDPVMFVETNVLAGVADAYGVLVTGESMVPAFRPGDIALVHPHKPARADCEVILQRDDAGTRYGSIKTLIRMSASEYRLKQWNPEKEFSRSKREWPTCHLVIGNYRR